MTESGYPAKGRQIQERTEKMKKEELLKEANPMLFNTDMVQAFLEGRKRVTRRLVKFLGGRSPNWSGYIKEGLVFYNGRNEVCNEKPPCRTGDIIYVRETWQFMPCIECRKENETCWKNREIYEDRQSESEGCFIYRAGHPLPERFCWRPSIHMPKKAARIFLKVTDIKVEHLQDMSLEDFLMEGIVLKPETFNDPENVFIEAQRMFRELWDSTIRKSDMDRYGWEANP